MTEFGLEEIRSKIRALTVNSTPTAIATIPGLATNVSLRLRRGSIEGSGSRGVLS